VLLPVGIIVAYISVPKKVTQNLNLNFNYDPGLPGEEIKIQFDPVIEKDNYQMAISLDSIPGHFIVFTNKKELTTPSLLLYKVVDHTTNDIDKQELLGRINSKGSSWFPLKGDPSNTYKFILYDIIKKHIIDSVTYNSVPHLARMKEVK
jgi:hypothetical protein